MGERDRERGKVRIVGTGGRPIFVDPRAGVTIGQEHWFGYGRYRDAKEMTILIVEAGEGGIPVMAAEFPMGRLGFSEDVAWGLLNVVSSLIDDDIVDFDVDYDPGEPDPDDPEPSRPDRDWNAYFWNHAPGLPPGR